MSLILLVDDAPIVREPIAAVLRAAGYEVECAASGTEALSKLQCRIPALMILDLSMPGMNGLLVLEVFRGTKSTRNIPVILLTGSADRKDILQASRLGVNNYLLKSAFTMSDLLSRVAALVLAEQT
jgi:CheY-like chemotaxis protein